MTKIRQQIILFFLLTVLFVLILVFAGGNEPRTGDTVRTMDWKQIYNEIQIRKG